MPGQVWAWPVLAYIRIEEAMVPRARYDELADWYNELLQDPARHEPLARSAFGLLSRLMGQGRGTVVDIGCGTGLATETVRALGYQPVGPDVSSDQLRLAKKLLPVALADAAKLPRESGSTQIAYSTFVWSDLDDLRGGIAEVYRVLESGGRYVAIGVHPCFYGSHSQPGPEETVVVHPGYRRTSFLETSPSGSTIRSRVGAWVWLVRV
jgi:ubiquinone/menaquinone biosynthesis C-methylase UbiE